MRFIPTFGARVEQLKLEAKKIQRKRGGKHTELLDRVARGAGYDHWHHVIHCQRQTAAKQGGQALLAECASIVRAEQAGEIKVVMTGPEVQVGPFVLFSTGIGDAWLLSPEEDLCLCLMWRGKINDPQITETAHELRIGWDAAYELAGPFLKLDPIDDRIAAQAVGGYPLQGVRKMVDRALSFEGKFAKVIDQEDAIDLTEAIIQELIKQGWEEAPLRSLANEGFRYSPSRNTVLGPVFVSDDGQI
ncbi:hypothetical protein [Paracidovorax citrulli]|uniref:hypothetical protein n=1 Tax=Paracidovorax citrulli TaxID=80869 RepID=UPI003FA7104A